MEASQAAVFSSKHVRIHMRMRRGGGGTLYFPCRNFVQCNLYYYMYPYPNTGIEQYIISGERAREECTSPPPPPPKKKKKKKKKTEGRREFGHGFVIWAKLAKCVPSPPPPPPRNEQVPYACDWMGGYFGEVNVPLRTQ